MPLVGYERPFITKIIGVDPPHKHTNDALIYTIYIIHMQHVIAITIISPAWREVSHRRTVKVIYSAINSGEVGRGLHELIKPTRSLYLSLDYSYV